MAGDAMRRRAIRRFVFEGLHGCRSVSDLEVVPLPNDRTLLIASERPDNPGTSVTNAAEELASQACEKLGIDPDKLVWIERYPRESCPVCKGKGRKSRKVCTACRGTGTRRESATYDLVTFRRRQPELPFRPASKKAWQQFFEEPQWRRMVDEDWKQLGVEPRQ
jgi:hypothetical protein